MPAVGRDSSRFVMAVNDVRTSLLCSKAALKFSLIHNLRQHIFYINILAFDVSPCPTDSVCCRPFESEQTSGKENLSTLLEFVYYRFKIFHNWDNDGYLLCVHGMQFMVVC